MHVRSPHCILDFVRGLWISVMDFCEYGSPATPWASVAGLPPTFHRKLTVLKGYKDSGGGDPKLELPIDACLPKIRKLVQEGAVVAVRGPPGCGKTRRLPSVLLDWRPGDRRAVVVAVPSVFSAQRIKLDVIDVCSLRWDQVHLKTGDDKEDQFHEGKTKISIVTYGVLWKWIAYSELASPTGILQRYKGFLLDEFASGHAKMDEIGTCLRKCISRVGDRLSRERLIATSAALRTDHVEMCFGNGVEVVEVLERPYSLYRYVAAPMNKDDLLVVCCRLLLRALEERDGNIIVFLPGFREITSLRSMLSREVALLDSVHLPRYCTVIRHSDTIGDDESEQDAKEDFEGTIVFLSTEICARSVTFADLGYVFVHPLCKTSVLHSSGCSELVYEKISADLERNEEGRGGRTRNTCVTYLYNVDDSAHALRSVEDCVSVEGSSREPSSTVAD